MIFLKKQMVLSAAAAIILLITLGIILAVTLYSDAETRPTDVECRVPYNREQCIPVKQCKTIMDIIQSYPEPVPDNVSKQLKKYVCVIERNITNVCCPSSPIRIANRSSSPEENTIHDRMVLRKSYEKSPTPSASPDSIDNKNFKPSVQNSSEPSTPLNITDHINMHLLPEDCGYSPADHKIRNGKDAGLREFPWMALIKYNTNRGPSFECGGTIINDRYILTAAHCLTDTSPLINVRVGEYDISSEMDCIEDKCLPPVQDLTIEKIIYHDDYDNISYENDIGLIRVSKINLNSVSTATICLPVTGERGNENYNTVTVTGWGFTHPNGTRNTTVLQKVDLSVRNLTDCIHAYRYVPWLYFSEKQLCIGNATDNKDSCGGDSGGPLQVIRFFDGEARYIQQGIVSYGHEECGKEGYPSIYTKVRYYMNWILDRIEP